MSSLTFDTLKFVDKLEKAGVSRAQASAIVEAQRDSLLEALDNQAATKEDVVSIKSDLREFKVQTEGRFLLLQWMLGFVIAMLLAILWRVFSS